MTKRLGIMTGGGDCPGLNAAIRAAAKTAIRRGYQVIGIMDGWRGLVDNQVMVLNDINTSAIIDRGGTILGTSRFSPFSTEEGVKQVFDSFKQQQLDALVVLGGEGTLSATARLYQAGLPVIGIPKTIDNDIRETDFSIGFQTAVQIATDALDRLRSTAESHHRVMLLEVMGHKTGWIATYSGLANGADAILIPELPLDDARLDELCQMIKHRDEKGKRFSIVVVAEGIELPPVTVQTCLAGQTLHGTGNSIGAIIESKTGLETRVSALGYVQRGGTPVAYDRSLATSFGVKAVDLVDAKRFGEMTALRQNKITSVPLAKVLGGLKTVDLNVYKVAEIFFG
ncbi:MAG: ATP-dependent 6-phosphofructokinase [Dehalococcoidales bacterium]|nr:ATP-dependent 6-phosphofructokinase [Dehalococcoidales bacterium]